MLINHYPSSQLLLSPQKFVPKKEALCLGFLKVFGDDRLGYEGNMPERDHSKLGEREGPLARCFDPVRKLNHEQRILAWSWAGALCTVWLVQVTEDWSGSPGPIFCSSSLAGLHKINGPSRFHVQPENGQMDGVCQPGSRSVRSQTSKLVIPKKPQEDRSQSLQRACC